MRRRVEAAELRRPGGHRRARLVVGSGVGIAVLLVGVPLFLAFGPVFTVRSIAVTGASGSLASAVQQAVAGQIGRPVALVGDGDVAKALETVPAVERFTVVRRPPDAIELVVVPRTAVAQEATTDGWAIVDAARVVIRTTADPDPQLPVVVVTAEARKAASYATAVSALRALDGASPAVARVRADSPDDVTVTLVGGLRVRWGGAEDGAEKAQALHAALRTAARGATVVDVSAPGVVLTR